MNFFCNKNINLPKLFDRFVNLFYFTKIRKENWWRFIDFVHKISILSICYHFRERTLGNSFLSLFFISLVMGNSLTFPRVHFAPERKEAYNTPSCGLCTLDNVWLRRFYDARSTYGVFQIVEGRSVRTMRRSVPIIIIDVFQLAFLRHISCKCVIEFF